MKATKSIWARIMVLCLTVAMVLSMATMGAFAVGNPISKTDQTGTVTVIGSANDAEAEVNLYKIIDVNMVNANGTIQPKDPMYTWVKNVGQWVETNYADYVNVIVGKDENTYVVTEKFANADAKTLADFYTKLAGSGVLGTAAYTIESLNDASKTVTGVAMGQYLVIATKGDYNYNPATATLAPTWGTNSWELNDATVVLKGKGGIDKEVVGGDLGHAVGDVVTYRLDVVIPVYPEAGPGETIYKTFKVGDTMGKGLTFNGVETVKVYANTSADSYATGEEVAMGTGDTANYAVTANGNSFDIDFTYDNLKTAVGNATYVHVVYTATLNEQAFTTDGLGNTAYVEVNTNPYDENSHEKTTVDKKVYTYGMTVTKVDAGNKETVLPDAEFKLYSDAACQTEIKFVESNGVYTKALDQASAGETLTTNSLGQITLGGLDVGTYYLKEVKAPGGYQLPANPVTTITLTDGDSSTKADGVLDEKTTTVSGSMLVEESTDYADNVVMFQLGNTKPGFHLPTTGGMGTVAFTAGGLVIMACGAALVLVTLKKKKAEG